MSSGATPSHSPAAGWYPDPLDPTSERLWDGGRWSEECRPSSTSVSALTPLQDRPTAAPSSLEPQPERSTSGWSAGSLVGLGVGLLALLTVGGCVALVGVIPLVAARSQNAFVEEEVEVAVEVPMMTVVPTTVGLPPEPLQEFPPTTIEPGIVVSDSAGPLATYGSTVEVGDLLNTGEMLLLEITVQQPVDLSEPVLAAGRSDFGLLPEEIVVGVPATIMVRESPRDPIPAGGLVDWTIVGGSSSAEYLPVPVGCDVVDDDLTAVDELVVGQQQTGVVCFLLPIEDLEHPETRVVLTLGKGGSATWIR